MKKMMGSRRAVSPVIASLLLIAIAVAASVITYSWIMTMIKSQGSQAQTSIRLEDVRFGRDETGTGEGAEIGDAVKITIRNTGSVPATIQTIYVYKGDNLVVRKDGAAFAISAQQVKAILLEETGITLSTVLPAMSADSGDQEITGQTIKGYDSTTPAELALSAAYTIKVVTDNGFISEGTYFAPSAWA